MREQTGINKLMVQSVLNGYQQDASFLIKSYEAITSADLLKHVSAFIPATPCKIIEIGAGTGRDAAWLAAKGHEVIAVEPVAAFRTAGQTLHPSPRITWINDSLPAISAIIQRGECYDLALLIAVWHHIPPEDKLAAFSNLRSIINKGGKLIISVRNGPGSITRRCYPSNVKETLDIAKQCKFKLITSHQASSAQKDNQASNVSWTWLVFTAT